MVLGEMGALTVSHRFGLLSQVGVRCGPPVVAEFLKNDQENLLEDEAGLNSASLNYCLKKKQDTSKT